MNCADFFTLSSPHTMTLRSFLAFLMNPGPQPRKALLLLAVLPTCLLGFGLYLQHIVGLEPCPMCIVQRYAMCLMVLLGLAFGWGRSVWLQGVGFLAYSALSGLGAYVAALQSWLQWHPPEVVSCGRDFYGMIEAFPLKQAIPMIFKGGGDCANVDWTLLGLSIANWSFLAFVGLGLSALWVLYDARRVRLNPTRV